MNYSNNIKSNKSFAETVKQVKDALQTEGFGILTETDVKQTMLKKLDKHMEEYVMLGACNPGFAFQALQIEKQVGLFLPCNVLVFKENNEITVSIIKPKELMEMINISELSKLAVEVDDALKRVTQVLKDVLN